MQTQAQAPTNLNRQQLILLKAKIKGLANEGLRTRQYINKAIGSKKSRYWGLKRSIGSEARHHLIAYGFLRGYTYKSMEPNSNRYVLNNNLNYEYIAAICNRHNWRFTWTSEYVRILIWKDV